MKNNQAKTLPADAPATTDEAMLFESRFRIDPSAPLSLPHLWPSQNHKVSHNVLQENRHTHVQIAIFKNSEGENSC